MKKVEIVISTTDKSGKLTISTYASYIQQGLPKTVKDKKVGWKEVMSSKEVVLSNTRVLSQVFKVGETHGEKNQTRVKKALHEDITVIPNLTILQKDHKLVDPDTGLPATRQVAPSTKGQMANYVQSSKEPQDLIQHVKQSARKT